VIWLCLLASAGTAGSRDQHQAARGSLEIALDALERRFFRPRFTYQLQLSSWQLISDIYFNETMNGDLEGIIDYWINLGLQKSTGPHRITFRLNHMCRHNTSVFNPEVLDLNEIYAHYGWQSPGFSAGIGLGTYTGGSASHRSIVTFNSRVTPFREPGISCRLALKWVDWKQLLHEAEIVFPLNSATSLFIRNARYYALKTNTFIGIRFATIPPVESVMDAMKLEVGVLPADEDYKTGVQGEYSLHFFNKTRKRLKLTMGFQAYLLKADKFFGKFYPDSMAYRVMMEYENLLTPELFLSWYSRYYLYSPIDKGIPFEAHLGTGILLKNRRDFDLADSPLGYEISAGYNFKHRLEGKARVGISLYRKGNFNVQWRTSVYFHGDMINTLVQLTSQWASGITIRPQLNWEYIQYREKLARAGYRFSFGVAFLKWYGHSSH
jgi:hypothetical protein